MTFERSPMHLGNKFWGPVKSKQNFLATISTGMFAQFLPQVFKNKKDGNKLNLLELLN